jgi:hypothetical protein
LLLDFARGLLLDDELLLELELELLLLDDELLLELELELLLLELEAAAPASSRGRLPLANARMLVCIARDWQRRALQNSFFNLCAGDPKYRSSID